MKGFGGQIEDIIGNQNTNSTAVITIEASDAGFQSTRCGTWTSDLSNLIPNSSTFGDGDWIVGTDITAGTFRSSGGSGCYWARLKGFGHTTDDVIANEIADAPTVVTISPSDKGFTATRCGTWTKV